MGHLTQAELQTHFRDTDMGLSEDCKNKEPLKSEAAEIICYQVERTCSRRRKAEPEGDGQLHLNNKSDVLDPTMPGCDMFILSVSVMKTCTFLFGSN